MNAHSGDTNLTKNSTPRNIPNSEKPGGTQLIQPWTPSKYDFEKLENLFTKHSKE